MHFEWSKTSFSEKELWHYRRIKKTHTRYCSSTSQWLFICLEWESAWNDSSVIISSFEYVNKRPGDLQWEINDWHVTWHETKPAELNIYALTFFWNFNFHQKKGDSANREMSYPTIGVLALFGQHLSVIAEKTFSSSLNPREHSIAKKTQWEKTNQIIKYQIDDSLKKSRD